MKIILKDISGWFFYFLYFIKIRWNVVLFNSINRIICKIKGIEIGEKTILNGRPVIRRYPESIIKIGNNCTINSSNSSVPIGLYKPSTFVTKRKDARIIIGNNSGASGVVLVAASKIEIGDNVLIGANCTIIDNDFHHPDPDKRESEDYPTRPIRIENNVFIGFNCFILKGVTIGENAVIGANSVVIHNIPKNAIAIGNPCKVIITKS
jgi:acetyltransferase-like isoleucine patch superfamily enzyme